MFEKNMKIAYLIDFYEDILDPHVASVMRSYYDDDLSLAEIAAEVGISRQGVRDVIVRAEAIMTELEDKTGLLKRFMQMRSHLDAIEEAANELKTINYRQYEDDRLSALADKVLDAAAALKE